MSSVFSGNEVEKQESSYNPVALKFTPDLESDNPQQEKLQNMPYSGKKKRENKAEA